LRLEGVAPSVAHRKSALQAALGPYGEVAAIDDMVSRRLWMAIRDAAPFAATQDGENHPLWRISTVPSRGHELAARITRAIEAEVLYDWAGGLFWIACRPRCRGCGAGERRSGPSADTQRPPAGRRIARGRRRAEPLDAIRLLTGEAKEVDPKGVLNPGRMWNGLIRSDLPELPESRPFDADRSRSPSSPIRACGGSERVPAHLRALRLARRPVRPSV
jgi:glycolate oxidase FAD binding subunit